MIHETKINDDDLIEILKTELDHSNIHINILKVSIRDNSLYVEWNSV